MAPEKSAKARTAHQQPAPERSAKARIAHHMPGRMRLRFERASDVPEAARRLEVALAETPGVRSVEARPAARSVVVHYDAIELKLEHLIEEGFPSAAVELLEEGTRVLATEAGKTAVGRSVVTAVGTLNEGVEKATGGVLDLRDAFPLTLIGLGVRRVLQGNLQPIPWYNLLYYGYSTFVNLHSRRPAHSQAGLDAREILARRYALGELSREELRVMLAELEGMSGPPGHSGEATGEA